MKTELEGTRFLFNLARQLGRAFGKVVSDVALEAFRGGHPPLNYGFCSRCRVALVEHLHAHYKRVHPTHRHVYEGFHDWGHRAKQRPGETMVELVARHAIEAEKERCVKCGKVRA